MLVQHRLSKAKVTTEQLKRLFQWILNLLTIAHRSQLIECSALTQYNILEVFKSFLLLSKICYDDTSSSSPTATAASLNVSQVWLLGTESIYSFCKKYWYARRSNQQKSITLSTWNNFLFRSSQKLLRLCLGPLKGFMSWPSALQGPSTRLMRCFQN